MRWGDGNHSFSNQINRYPVATRSRLPGFCSPSSVSDSKEWVLSFKSGSPQQSSDSVTVPFQVVNPTHLNPLPCNSSLRMGASSYCCWPILLINLLGFKALWYKNTVWGNYWRRTYVILTQFGRASELISRVNNWSGSEIVPRYSTTSSKKKEK